MVFNTFAVGAAVTPCVIETSLSHYINRKPLQSKPTAHISYHVGLNLVRQFLDFASHHTVDELQAFTQQWVPTPRWVRTEDITIKEQHIAAAVKHIQTQLGAAGIEAVGGPTWWQWRKEHDPLKAEWIEMRKDYNARKQAGENCTRSMLYVHGGAYYFGSVDEHRYQLQRHARKLQARVLAPRYRLSPQFPFPCGLLDGLATYLEMLETQPPETIVLAGDSAGGGMVLSLMVILRDQGLPMPAGAVLLSPWVDLTHSFPSVAGDNDFDYIPAHGFHHRPSMSWPPPNSDDVKVLQETRQTSSKDKTTFASGVTVTRLPNATAARGFDVPSGIGHKHDSSRSESTAGSHNLSIDIDGKHIELKDQIQMYAHNGLLSHPLVSPVMQPSLGGLPPLLILTGGGEMLRDEQIYLAHKAAAPSSYSASRSVLESQGPDSADAVHKWKPTDVQLQVWDDMCHVAPTLSFTRPAKYMYRSVAQFGAWALARAQQKGIRILDDDEVSVISSGSSDDEASKTSGSDLTKKNIDRQHRMHEMGVVGKAGDALPRFHDHMIRQRVTRHGEIYPLEPASQLPACTIRPEEVGTIKPGPVRKWLAADAEWSKRYGKEKRKIQQRRLEEMTAGYVEFAGETPPPTALAGRRKQDYVSKPQERKKSRALAMWSGWGSKHDENTLKREDDKEKVGAKTVDPDGAAASANLRPEGPARERSASRMRDVMYEGQTDHAIVPENSKRPVQGGVAFPFKLGSLANGEQVNASTVTLTEHAGIIAAPEASGPEPVIERPALGSFVMAKEVPTVGQSNS